MVAFSILFMDFFGLKLAQIGSKWLERALKILAYSNFTRIHLRGLIFYVVNLW